MANANFARRQKFISTLPSEVSEFTWQIENLKAVLGMAEALQDLKLDVEAGHTIQLPTRWRFYFEIVGEQQILGICVKLLESPEERENVFANFDFTIGHTEVKDKDISNYKKGSNAFFYLPAAFQFVKEPGLLDKLSDDPLTLHLRLTLYKDLQMTEVEADEPKVEKVNDTFRSPILEDFNELLESGVNADIKIQTKDGKDLQAHRAILSSRSPVFFAMFQTEMTESSSGIVHIKDLSSEAMRIVLKFIYTGKVDVNWVNKFEEIINAAEKYHLILLKEYCDRNLVKICTPKNVWIPLRKAQQFRLKQAEKDISDYIADNIRAILEANKLE